MPHATETSVKYEIISAKEHASISSDAPQYHKNPRACFSALNIEDPYTNRIIFLRFINVICAASLLLYIAGRIRVAF